MPHIRDVLYRTAVCNLCAVAGPEPGWVLVLGREPALQDPVGELHELEAEVGGSGAHVRGQAEEHEVNELQDQSTEGGEHTCTDGVQSGDDGDQ